MEYQENGEFAQAIIENVFLLKDGSLVAGCYLTCGTIHKGEKLFYTDCVGRKSFPLTIADIAVPQKGSVEQISAGDEFSRQVACKIAENLAGHIHPGHMIQNEAEEVLYTEAPGWDAISKCFEAKYPNQKNPAHFGCYASFKPGEAGPLDGVNIYNGGEYFHFVTYGLSELYEKQNGNPDRSGYGFELTLKLKKEGLENPALEVRHMCSILQMMAGITVNNGHQFLPGQFLALGQQKGFDAAGKSGLMGFITKEDELGTIGSPFGKVQLIQLVGVKADEMEKMKNRELTPAELGEQLKDGLTDYKR